MNKILKEKISESVSSVLPITIIVLLLSVTITPMPVGTMVLFCMLLGIFAIGAPGVPGGTVMASLGLITGILLFDGTGTALMLTIFALQDSFGTACNVSGDNAIAVVIDKVYKTWIEK